MDIYLKTLIERKCTEDTRFFEDCRDPSIQRTEGLSAKKVLEKLEEGKDGIAELQDYERQYQNDRITTKYRRDQHLASALSLSSIKFIMNKSIMEKLQGGKRTHKPYCHNVLVKGQSGMPVELKEGHNHAFLSCLISNFPNDLDQYCMTKMRWKVQNQEMCEDLVRAVDRATQVSVDHLYDSFDDDCKPNVELKPTEISPYTQKLLLAKIDAQLAVQLASNDRERQRVLSVLGRQFTIVDNYIKFQCTKGKDKEDWHCGTWNHFLAYVDFILGHSAISLYLDFVKSKRKGAKVQYELYHDLSQLIFKAHFHYGNKVYNLLKNLKPFFTAIIMELIEPIKDEVFIRDCKAELMSNFNEANMPFYDMLLIWLSKLKDKINDKRELSHQLIFYSSLVKSYGHPDVDMMKGVEKVRRIGARDKQVDKEIVRLVTGCVKWNFVESYFNVNKQWPIILNPPSVILKYINIQKLPPKRLHFTFAKLLIDARFGKMFDFETFDNGKDLLKDSAVIQSSSHWPFEYDQDAFYYVNNIHLPRYVRDEKRVILTDLKDEMDVRYEVEKFNDQGPNDNDLIIIAIPKERELKEEPRLFVKLTYKMRMLQILAENNVAQHVLRFSESQSMIMKSDKVMQKLLEFSGKVRYDDFIKVAQSMIHADFQSWNLQFREEMMGGVMSFFDEIHGLSQYYTRFHQFFADSTVMVQDMFNPPRMDPYTGKAIPDEYTCWQLHWGGFEGMLQKSWTVFTMGLLTLAAFETHSEITSFGSGDNQIVLLTLSPTPLVKDLSLKIQREKMNKINDEEMMTDFRNKTLNHIHRYRNKLTSFAALIELPLKKEESFFTFGLMEYGSEMSVLGVSAAYESKVLFRLGTNINSPVKSIFDNLVTPGANGVSGSMKCYNPISLYQISTFETLFCAAGYGLFHQTLIGVPENDYKLVTTSKWSPYSMRIEDGKYNLYREFIRRSGVRLILIPRLFGGISCPPLYSYLFRGYEDDLCFTLDLARFLMTNAKNQEDFDLGNELLDININENDSVDTLLLLESPYSLPVKSFPLPQNVYDTITSRVLYEFTKEKNPGMAKVYKAIETRDIEKETAKAIADTVPFYPLWGAPCLEITPVMQARQSLRRFSTTTSIRQMVYSQDELTQDILDKTVQIYNLNTIRWLRWRILDWSNKPRPDIQKSKIYPIVSPWIVQLMDCSMTVGEIADEMRCFYWKREIQGVTNYWFRDQVYIKRSDGVTTDERQQLIELIADYDLDQQQPEWGIEYTRGNFRATLGSKTQMKLKGGLVEVDMSSIQTKYLVALLKRIIWASDGDSLYDLGRQIAAQITPQSFEDLLPLMPMYVGGSIEHRALAAVMNVGFMQIHLEALIVIIALGCQQELFSIGNQQIDLFIFKEFSKHHRVFYVDCWS